MFEVSVGEFRGRYQGSSRHLAKNGLFIEKDRDLRAETKGLVGLVGQLSDAFEILATTTANRTGSAVLSEDN